MLYIPLLGVSGSDLSRCPVLKKNISNLFYLLSLWKDTFYEVAAALFRHKSQNCFFFAITSRRYNTLGYLKILFVCQPRSLHQLHMIMKTSCGSGHKCWPTLQWAPGWANGKRGRGRVTGRGNHRQKKNQRRNRHRLNRVRDRRYTYPDTFHWHKCTNISLSFFSIW